MILIQILKIYLTLIVLRALLSWFNPDPAAPLMRLLIWVTEPALSPIRRIIPPIGGRIDLAPLIVVLIGGWLLTRLRF